MIITKPFKIQVLLFNLVTATLFVLLMTTVTLKSFVKLKHFGENCILGGSFQGTNL